jgi:hypothetical protein
MSKGIATETIIKIMLGLIAIVIIVYLLYRYVLKSPISETECKTRFTAWCANCQIVVFSGGPEPDVGLKQCIKKYTTLNLDSVTSCNSHEGDCKGYLPVTS